MIIHLQQNISIIEERPIWKITWYRYKMLKIVCIFTKLIFHQDFDLTKIVDSLYFYFWRYFVIICTPFFILCCFFTFFWENSAEKAKFSISFPRILLQMEKLICFPNMVRMTISIQHLNSTSKTNKTNCKKPCFCLNLNV